MKYETLSWLVIAVSLAGFAITRTLDNKKQKAPDQGQSKDQTPNSKITDEAAERIMGIVLGMILLFVVLALFYAISRYGAVINTLILGESFLLGAGIVSYISWRVWAEKVLKGAQGEELERLRSNRESGGTDDILFSACYLTYSS